MPAQQGGVPAQLLQAMLPIQPTFLIAISAFPSCPCTRSFEAEAARVLEELTRFPELERGAAADFTAGMAVQLERLFAPPAALGRCI